MNATAPQPARLTRRWLKAVVITLGVMVGLFAATAGALALESADSVESCCCDNMAQQASSAGADHRVQSVGCCAGRSVQACPCTMDCDGATPGAELAATSAAPFSFSAQPSPLHPQLELPLARAPSPASTVWLQSRPPSKPLYLLHSVLLI